MNGIFLPDARVDKTQASTQKTGTFETFMQYAGHGEGKLSATAGRSRFFSFAVKELVPKENVCSGGYLNKRQFLPGYFRCGSLFHPPGAVYARTQCRRAYPASFLWWQILVEHESR